MNILTNYILKKYLMNFMIVLISLEIFFVTFDSFNPIIYSKLNQFLKVLAVIPNFLEISIFFIPNLLNSLA